MKRTLLLILLLIGVQSFGMNATHGDWIFSCGFGVMASPTLVLLNPQLEYVEKHDVFFGGMAQMGLGDGGDLLGFSSTARIVLGDHPRVKPFMEGGVGFALASGVGDSSFGFLLHGGAGFDYVVDRRFTLGTNVRFNFAPPIKNLFISWPIIVARFLL